MQICINIMQIIYANRASLKMYIRMSVRLGRHLRKFLLHFLLDLLTKFADLRYFFKVLRWLVQLNTLVDYV